MATATAEQLFIGTRSSVDGPGADSQISLLDFPRSFVWLRHFNATEIAEFFNELLEALRKSQETEDWSHVAEVIGDWQETASIKADPVLVAAIEQGQEELSRGEAHDWESLRRELDL